MVLTASLSEPELDDGDAGEVMAGKLFKSLLTISTSCWTSTMAVRTTSTQVYGLEEVFSRVLEMGE